MVILLQPDLAAAVAFYKKLGCKQAFYISSKWAEFQLGDTKLGLCPINAEGPIATRTGLVFEVANMNQFMADMKGACEFIGEPIEKPHGIMLSIKDPGGNIIDVYQPTPEKLKEYLAAQAQMAQDEGCCGRKATACKSESQPEPEQKKSSCCKDDSKCGG